MPHSQADFALDAFSVHIAEQKKSQIKESVTMIAPCHKLWPAEGYHWQLHNALRATDILRLAASHPQVYDTSAYSLVC